MFYNQLARTRILSFLAKHEALSHIASAINGTGARALSRTVLPLGLRKGITFILYPRELPQH